MSEISHIVGAALLHSRERLEAISTNAASAVLPGYRRHVVVGRPFEAAMAALDEPTAHAVDLRTGSIVVTGRALDVSIEAEDLFFALTDGSRTWFTRSGAFRPDQDGVLVGEGGLAVVGADGPIRSTGSDLTVEADARLTHQGATLGSLQLFRPTDRAQLQAAQGSLLTAPLDSMQPVEPEAVRVRGGALEASNTDATREMLDLMILSRQFESLSRLLQGYDELLGRAIQKLGEV